MIVLLKAVTAGSQLGPGHTKGCWEGQTHKSAVGLWKCAPHKGTRLSGVFWGYHKHLIRELSVREAALGWQTPAPVRTDGEQRCRAHNARGPAHRRKLSRSSPQSSTCHNSCDALCCEAKRYRFLYGTVIPTGPLPPSLQHTQTLCSYCLWSFACPTWAKAQGSRETETSSVKENNTDCRGGTSLA